VELGTSKAPRISIKEQLLTGKKKKEEIYEATVDVKRQKKKGHIFREVVEKGKMARNRAKKEQ
jgi:hypothetical protein